MSLLRILPAEDRSRPLTREELASIFERTFEIVSEEVQEHPEGQDFIERLCARLPPECLELLLEDGALELDDARVPTS